MVREFNQISYLLVRKFVVRAKCWGEAFITIFQSVQAFDRAFLSLFCDATKQLHIRLKIEGGRFEKGTYVKHFTKFVAMLLNQC